jgi:hypothetical protein
MKNNLAILLFFVLLPHYIFSQDHQLKQKVVDLANVYYKQGLTKKPYHSSEMNYLLSADSTEWTQSIYFKAALLIAEDLVSPILVKPWFTFDAVSKPILERKMNTIRERLSQMRNARSLDSFFSALICPTGTGTKMIYDEYQRRLLLFNRYSAKADRDTLSWLKQAFAVYKWIDQLEIPRYVIVDIGCAELRYVVKGVDSIVMRAVVGKPSTPTPFFASWTDQLVLYPFWHVPMSIAVDEFLPKIKRNRAWLNEQNMQVVDRKGFVLDADTINWKKMNREYFPYTLRQSTGCDNALGVVKVEFSSPYGVYIHDTNNKASFLNLHRYLSHGCIRVEEPIKLGNLLIENKLDSSFLQSCLFDQKPLYFKVLNPIPVFVIYTNVRNAGEKIIYSKDIYNYF